ncbi:MAG: hypothetical protein JWM11_5101 [Planctomycetaceae bacterium]|nr:hypothetical protein [Planctomycetaceae bacterium]
MARARLDKTLADYVVIAISPALIMTLVGSLVFFLLTVGYRGQFESRMHWIMFWFVFGAVLVARIAIEEGKERARIFGVVLCGAVAFGVMRFIDAVFLAWTLLAVVWWCSSKLTWDCTLIDESEDASGEGLLQTAGFNTADGAATPDSQTGPEAAQRIVGTTRADRKSKSLRASEEREHINTTIEDSISEDSESGKSRPHAPGLWVVYFSLAALPLFGVGQLFIPAQETDRRAYAFQLLAVYVASAIALLLTTSFLGLRRYLRQRKLEMPAVMTRTWLGMGTVLLVAILLLALLIPRPQGEYTLTALIDKIDAKVRKASKFAVLKNDRAAGEGRRIGDQDPQAKQPGQGQPPGHQQPGGQGDGKAQPGQPGDRDGKGDDKSADKSGGKQAGKGTDQSHKQADPNSGKPDPQDNAAGQQRPNEPQQNGAQQGNPPQKPDLAQQAQQANQAQKPQPPDQAQQPQQAAANNPAPANTSTSAVASLLAMLAPLMKWILYGLLLLVGIFFLIRYWPQLVEILAKLWAELLSLFGRRPNPAAGTDESQVASTVRNVRPFASYVNPFSNGTANRMSPPQLVRYTFEALEAWARETVVERPPEQTPLEFADELGRRVPMIAQEVAQTTRLYMHLAYSREPLSRDRLEVLERMWRRLEV